MSSAVPAAKPCRLSTTARWTSSSTDFDLVHRDAERLGQLGLRRRAAEGGGQLLLRGLQAAGAAAHRAARPVQAAQLVEQRAADAGRGEAAERDSALGSKVWAAVASAAMPAETRSSRLTCDGRRLSISRTRCPTSGRWLRTRSSTERFAIGAVATEGLTATSSQAMCRADIGSTAAGDPPGFPAIGWPSTRLGRCGCGTRSRTVAVELPCRRPPVETLRCWRRPSIGQATHTLGACCTTEGAAVGLADLSSILWREREMLELLLFKLEEEQLILASGRGRWLAHATREVEMVLDQIRRTEVVRAAEVEVDRRSARARPGRQPRPARRRGAGAVGRPAARAPQGVPRARRRGQRAGRGQPRPAHRRSARRPGDDAGVRRVGRDLRPARRNGRRRPPYPTPRPGGVT